MVLVYRHQKRLNRLPAFTRMAWCSQYGETTTTLNNPKFYVEHSDENL